jgi:F1F0 ATPase subunit 2
MKASRAMSDALTLIASWTAGAALSVLFFGGLWWSIARGIASPRPALWFAVSLLLRASVVLGGIYLVGQGDWRRMAACLVGFAMTRPLVLWSIRHWTREAGHAPDA